MTWILSLLLATSSPASSPALPLPAAVMPEEKAHQIGEDESKAVDNLIDATLQKLDQQKELKRLMALFRDQEERFFRGDQSKEHSSKMVNTARQILDLIKKGHLEHLFSSEYMEELALFSSIAGRTTPARP
ncbi:MAG: hypothetical protein HYX48_02630 [Chlamydiales bacterium]|nr:hypothetical protein [Chlamydiales bacterium]